MSKALVIVESPTKVRTLEKYLDKHYKIVATVGHIKDLPRREIGIDIENGFKPQYETIAGKEKVVRDLKKAAENISEIFLAPDPDREGEAIAWHTADLLDKKGRHFHRVLFHELTQNAILKAISEPEKLNFNKFEAQQARRILDRLVGYQVSPLLWRKVKSGLSAGRVQSVAVRIICERERSIHAFESEEYWSITVHVKGDQPPEFPAKLVKKAGKKIEIADQAQAEAILAELAGQNLIVEKILKKTKKRTPPPPFTTSKLQQEAIRRLRFSAKKTMTVAQQLYEGIELGPGEPVGLITYMRTDSVRISQQAAEEALELIRRQFGNAYAPNKPRFFKNAKKVQDAHEAIRPTSVENTPEAVAAFLNHDQMELYRLIWRRFVASQMSEALINTNSVSIKAGAFVFNASGSSIAFPGFMALYVASDDESEADKKVMLPELSENMVLQLLRYEPKQHFTQPPPRFSEATLVKELEENGIGRPSTYAAILSTIREKGYVDMEKGYFRPSELGFIVNDMLVENFPDIFNVAFTARMEDDLDRIESAELPCLEILSRFYNTFKPALDTATQAMISAKGVGVSTELSCPKCQKPLHVKIGKNGPFLACSGYPSCDFTANFTRDEKGKICPAQPPQAQASDQTCPLCGLPMILRQGRYGAFLACSGYPKCRSTRSLNSQGSETSTGLNCPQPECSGKIVEKKSRRGKIFYGCSAYPKCTYATWNKPVPKSCPQCQAPFLVEKSTKQRGTFLVCPAGCGFKELLPEEIKIDKAKKD